LQGVVTSNEPEVVEFAPEPATDNDATTSTKLSCETKGTLATIPEKWNEEKPHLALETGEAKSNDTEIADAPVTKDSKCKMDDMGYCKGAPSTQRMNSRLVLNTRDTTMFCDSHEIPRKFTENAAFTTSIGNDVLETTKEVTSLIQRSQSNIAVEQVSPRFDNDPAVLSQSFSVAEYKSLCEIETEQMEDEDDKSVPVVKLTPFSRKCQKAARNIFARKMIFHSSSLFRLRKSIKARSRIVTYPTLESDSQINPLQNKVNASNDNTEAFHNSIEVNSSTDKTETILSTGEDEASPVDKGTRETNGIDRLSISTKAGIEKGILAFHTIGGAKMFQRLYPTATATPKSCTVVNCYQLDEIEILEDIPNTR
jgi:hypothetical protein